MLTLLINEVAFLSSPQLDNSTLTLISIILKETGELDFISVTLFKL